MLEEKENMFLSTNYDLREAENCVDLFTFLTVLAPANGNWAFSTSSKHKSKSSAKSKVKIPKKHIFR